MRLVTRAGDAAYRALLYALPADLRGEVGDDAAQLFHDERRALRGHPLRLAALWMAGIADVGTAAWRERRDRAGRPLPPQRGFLMSSILQDLRYAVRLLWRDRGFAALAIAIMAIGIGANSAAFGLVNTLLLKPRPGHPAGEIAGVYCRDLAKAGAFRAFSYSEFEELRQHREIFAAIAVHNFAFVGITDGDHTRQAIVDMVSREFFQVFGAPLARGRTFTLDEERPGSGADVAILSYAAWQRRGGGSDVLGSTVRVNGRMLTVVGVAEKDFGGSLAMITPELWVPISAYDRLANDFVREGMTTPLADRRTQRLIVDAQLQPGLTIETTKGALAPLMAALTAVNPSSKAHEELLLAPLARMSVSTSPRDDGDMRAITIALLSLSGIVLLTASLNLANMLLARGAARRREFAIRMAIGGGRGRLIRQLLTEGLLLALLGGAAGLVLASWATSALAAGLAPYIPVTLLIDPLPDVRVLGATFTFCVASALVSSVWPAWTLTRADALPGLRDQAGDGRSRARFGSRNLLVTGQLALSLVMLTAAGLFIRSSWEAAGANPGFTLDRGILVQVDASLAGKTPDQMAQLYARMLDRLRARPDVRAASLSSNMAFTDFSDQRPVQRAGAPLPDGDPMKPSAEFVSVSTDYFRTLDLPLLRGRDFHAGEDMIRAPHRSAIIDEPLAKQLFGQADPVGQSIQYDTLGHEPPEVLEIVGVVPGVLSELVDAAPVPHFYVPYGQEPRGSVYLNVAASGPTAAADIALLPEVRQALAAVDRDVPILSLETRAMFRDRNLLLAVLRTGARVFGVFGLAALGLAAAGVYGVKAYLVSRRSREIGIRVALGATRTSVVWLIAREGLALAVAGLAVGAVLAVAAATGLRALMYQRHGADATILLATVAVLLGASLVAAIVPARRAARVDPAAVLRQ